MHKMITASVLTAATITGGVALAAPAQAVPVYPSSSGSPVLESANVTTGGQLKANSITPQDLQNLERNMAGYEYVGQVGFDVAAIMKFKPGR